MLLKPLPYQDPGRLVTVWSHNTAENKPENPISPANFVDLRDEARSFATLEGYFSFVTNTQIVLDGPPEIAVTSFVSPGLFQLLGRTAMLGRAIQPGDGAGITVISHGYWQRRFGGDPSVVGRQVTADGQPATIVGVMPPEFVFPYKGMVGPTGFTRTMDVDAWTTMVMTGPRMVDQSGRFIRNVHYLGAVGRLQPGVSVEQARAGTGRGRIAAGTGLSRHQQGLDDHGQRAARTGGGQRPPGAAGADRRRGAHPADGLRQRRQPRAGARREPAEGTGGAGDARRHPGAVDAAGARRRACCWP